MSDSKTEGGSAPSPSVPRTPEEIAANLVHGGPPYLCTETERYGPETICIDCDKIIDALAEGRAAALEAAARYVENCAATASIGGGMMQIVTTDQVAAGIRALLNQGRDEVAPSPEITSKSPATDPEAK